MQRKLFVVGECSLVITELLNIPINDFDAKESTRCRQVLTVTELVVSKTQCNWRKNSLLAKCVIMTHMKINFQTRQFTERQNESPF